MADAATIMARVRAAGADVVLQDGRLSIVGGGRMSAEARNFIVQHRDAIASYLAEVAEDAFEERAAIIEFDGRAPRQWAEQFARILYQRRPAGVSELDWSWFVTACGRIIDEAPERAAA